MCNKCACTDPEICTMCDAHYGEEKPGVQFVTLDADTQGELMSKLKDVVDEELSELRKYIWEEKYDQSKVVTENLTITLGLLFKLEEGKITNEDLEYIDVM